MEYSVKKASLTPSTINFLQEENTLYSCDMRAEGETHTEIPELWKFENLMPWILDGKHALVNEEYADLRYPHRNKYSIASKGTGSLITIYQRLGDALIADVGRLWVAVPHPDADRLAALRGWKLNYSYQDFLSYNEKLSQKRLLGTLTPPWKEIPGTEVDQLVKDRGDGFLKFHRGAAGVGVFPLATAAGDWRFKKLRAEHSDGWFVEDRIAGNACSIQCVKDSSTTTVFGYTEQIIEEGKYFVGSVIHPLSELGDDIFSQLAQAITSLMPLLDTYEGFFGIDFMIDAARRIFVLEANVRLTSATIPALLAAEQQASRAIYKEDVPLADVPDGAIRLTIDTIKNRADVLTIER